MHDFYALYHIPMQSISQKCMSTTMVLQEHLGPVTVCINTIPPTASISTLKEIGKLQDSEFYLELPHVGDINTIFSWSHIYSSIQP